jgi:uncharacterized protein YukE
MLEWVGGNWGQLLSLRDAWNNLAFASADIGKNLQAGKAELDPQWNGNAALAFEGHMGLWQTTFQQNEQAATAVRDKLSDLAQNAKQAVDQIIQTIKTVVSIVTAALSSFAIPVYGQAKAVKAIWDTVKLINDVRKVVSAFVNLVKLAKEFFQSMQEIADDKTPQVKVDVPAAPYAAPAG